MTEFIQKCGLKFLLAQNDSCGGGDRGGGNFYFNNVLFDKEQKLCLLLQ